MLTAISVYCNQKQYSIVSDMIDIYIYKMWSSVSHDKYLMTAIFKEYYLIIIKSSKVKYLKLK